MSVKLKVDEIIKLDTIRYHRLQNQDETYEDSTGPQSLFDDEDKTFTALDAEDPTLLHEEDFSWFRRSIHFLVFFIGLAGFLLIALLLVPRHYITGSLLENGFSVRIPVDIRRIEAAGQRRSGIRQTLPTRKSTENETEVSSDKYQTIPTAGAFRITFTETSSQTIPPKPLVYIPPTETKQLMCSEFLKPGFDFTQYRHNRITYKDPKVADELKMDCDSIRRRSYFQTEVLYPEEKSFPIAFARAVFKDYRFLEMELAASFAPQNFYCYALDLNASSLFHDRMHALAKCFSNIYLTSMEYSMDSSGHNMGYSHLECMKLLTKPEFKWKYMILLQNHDVALKTNQELIQIFKWFNGTNDISANNVPRERLNANSNWTFEALHLFKNETRNLHPYKGFKPELTLAKSLVSVSRAMIDFMLDELDLAGVMRQIDRKEKYGVDEILMGSLNAADAVGAPGGYTQYCLKHHKGDSAVTRLSYWKGMRCDSGLWRHFNCLFGVEHLLELSGAYHLFANKFMPDEDFGAISCWHELIFNRTHIERRLDRLDADLYLNLPHVRYNRDRDLRGDGFDINKFNCTSSH